MPRIQVFVRNIKNGFEGARYLDTGASRPIRYFDTGAGPTADRVQNCPSIIWHRASYPLDILSPRFDISTPEIR